MCVCVCVVWSMHTGVCRCTLLGMCIWRRPEDIRNLSLLLSLLLLLVVVVVICMCVCTVREQLCGVCSFLSSSCGFWEYNGWLRFCDTATLTVSQLYHLRQDLSVEPEFSMLIMLDGLSSPGICLSQLPQCWDYQHTWSCLAFHVGAGDLNSGPLPFIANTLTHCAIFST